MKRFRDWRIQPKILSITIITMTAMMIGLFAYILPYFKKNLMNEKEDATRHIVELAMGILESHDSAVKAGRMPLEEAQKSAAVLLQSCVTKARSISGLMTLANLLPK